MSAAVSLWPAPLRPHRKLSTPLRHASPRLHPDCSATYRRSSLLATAVATWNAEQATEISVLLSAGASVHQQDTDGNTCLHHILFSAQPHQHWTVLSLTALLRAGANPSRPNASGYTSFDIACNAPSPLGSFRRDLLLQALLESDKEIPDSRLFAPTRLTSVYTMIRHKILFNDGTPEADTVVQTELLQRITEFMEQRDVLTDPKLHSTALQRVLEHYALGTFVDRETIFNDTLQYLGLMCQGKSEIVRLCRARFNKIASVQLGEDINLLQMAQIANTGALLEFDWWRPVDIEDLFSAYVDCLIDQLEELSITNQETARRVEGLIDMLQNAVPSYRTCSLRGSQCSKHDSEAEKRPPDAGKEFLTVPRVSENDSASDEEYGSYRDWLKYVESEESTEEDKARKESIVKTPVEFYAKTPW